MARIVCEDESFVRIAELKRSSGKREMVVPGDLVRVRTLEPDRAIVDALEPRAGVLRRRNAVRSKTVAANIDTIAVVTALANPSPRLLLLDALLAFAQMESFDALVIFTKPDLAAKKGTAQLCALYEPLGYAVIVVNPKTGEGMDALTGALENRHAVLTGLSGVGKSSIFRALGGPAEIGAVSSGGQGRQTTTSAHLYRTAHGFLIDSPGLAEFGLGPIDAAELAGGFREIAAAAPQCRFRDCAHYREPGCAVREGVAKGTIAPSRYHSFRSILEGR